MVSRLERRLARLERIMKAAPPEWEGDYGLYPIPKEFHDIKIRKDHWPDRRYKRAKDLIAWAMERDRQEMLRLTRDTGPE